MDASMDAVATDALASSNAWNQRKNTAQSTLDRSGTIRISVEHSFKKMVRLPQVHEWKGAHNEYLSVKVHRKGLLFPHSSGWIQRRCVLTSKGYFIIYMREDHLKGHTVSLSLAERMKLSSSRLDSRKDTVGHDDCLITFKLHYGSLRILLSANQVDHWRPALLRAFDSVFTDSRADTQHRDVACTTDLPYEENIGANDMAPITDKQERASSALSALSDSSLTDSQYSSESLATALSRSDTEEQTTVIPAADSRVRNQVSQLGHQVSHIERLCEKLRSAFDESVQPEDGKVHDNDNSTMSILYESHLGTDHRQVYRMPSSLSEASHPDKDATKKELLTSTTAPTFTKITDRPMETANAKLFIPHQRGPMPLPPPPMMPRLRHVPLGSSRTLVDTSSVQASDSDVYTLTCWQP